jgi:adenosylhomocysteine nucleosidase
MRDMSFAVIVSANAEWESVKPMFRPIQIEHSPFGEYFFAGVAAGQRALFFHGGWGKVAAAASTQYVIDHFKPRFLVNLGTCGGIAGRVSRFDVIAAERTMIYDIHEAMDESHVGIAHYTTNLSVPADLPPKIIRTTIYSADRDLTPFHLRELEKQFHPRVVDWESGAIAWVAKRNKTSLLIVRGVTDLVSLDKAEAEGNLALFRENARRIMQTLVDDLPMYISAVLAAHDTGGISSTGFSEES